MIRLVRPERRHAAIAGSRPRSGSAASPRRGPADYDKFRAVETFDLAPQAAVAECPGRIDAFRDDALDMHRASFVMKFRAMPDDVVAIAQAGPGVCEQCAEPLLALDQRLRAEILFVEVKKIEQEEDQRRRIAAV
jgi:hypothetical protein